jgi:glucuronate isomerase
MLQPDRFFDPEPRQKSIALELYAGIKDLPLICPHGHVDPALFATPNYRFGNPVELIVQPDHYVLRMLYSQGIAYERLLTQENPREVWRIFASHFHLFQGTPSGMWLAHSLETVFGVTEKLSAANADASYDQIENQLALAHCSPRALFERFNIAVLATTDAATDTLEQHRAMRAAGWSGGSKVIPTFRPDNVVNLHALHWRKHIDQLAVVSGVDIGNYAAFVRALEQRRIEFKALGATATDSGVFSPATEPLSAQSADAVFQRALNGAASADDAARFTSHMLFELARMSADDGLVMQVHPGSLRNYNPEIFGKYGADRGFDIPVATEYTRSLRPLLERFGNHPNFAMILFTLDETTYARELAPLAGAYPSVKLGPPWWFHDSWNGIRRFFDQVMETAGVYNTAGFNDDTRAFPSIPARHDLWRRAAANWLAGLVVRHMIDLSDAETLAQALAVGLARRAYRL